MTAAAWDRDALLASPWFAAVRPLVERLPADRFPSLDDLNALARERGVRSGGEAPLVFVPPGSGPRAATDATRSGSSAPARSRRATGAGTISTTRSRGSHSPGPKHCFNRVHHDELGRRGAGSTRGTARDVLTLFDEGGVIVACADPALARLLEGFHWKRLFWNQRVEVARSMRFFVFGHAILEHALAPFKGVTAKALVIEIGPDAPALVDHLDAAAAAHFARPESLASTRALQPLPVLGIPGWAAENEDPAFYDDVAVFRPGRAPKPRCQG